MAFTEKELREQELAFTAVKEELSRLNALFEGMLKDSGLTSAALKKCLEEKRSAELDKAFSQARAEAERAGKTRAAQVGVLAEQAKSAARGRPGAVKI